MSTPNEQRTAEAALDSLKQIAFYGGDPDGIEKLAGTILSAITAPASPVGQDALAAMQVRFNKQVHYGIQLARAIEHHAHGLIVPPQIANDCPHHASLLNETLASASRAAVAVEEAIGRLDSEARRAQIYANVSVYDLRLVIDALRAATKPKANEGMEREDSNP